MRQTHSPDFRQSKKNWVVFFFIYFCGFYFVFSFSQFNVSFLHFCFFFCFPFCLSIEFVCVLVKIIDSELGCCCCFFVISFYFSWFFVDDAMAFINLLCIVGFCVILFPFYL